MKNKLRKDEFSLSEMLILPDGRILAQNITPMVANLLSKLNPKDRFMRQRARASNKRGLIHKVHKQS
jgi:hypothetical protein